MRSRCSRRQAAVRRPPRQVDLDAQFVVLLIRVVHRRPHGGGPDLDSQAVRRHVYSARIQSIQILDQRPPEVTVRMAEHANAFRPAPYDHATVEACDRHVVAQMHGGDVPSTSTMSALSIARGRRLLQTQSAVNSFNATFLNSSPVRASAKNRQALAPWFSSSCARSGVYSK